MMNVSNSLAEWRLRRESMLGSMPGGRGRGIGLVPTMGALHEGHASLVRRCRAENEIVVATIFVNPTQFNDPNDLARYPRTMESDLALLESLGTDEVIVPTAAELYPNGYRFKVEAASLTNTLEGAYRQGFFEGVMTVVMKLLNLVRADRAYFGEKDFQQLSIVAEMTAEFFIPTEIVACPTVREVSGLAASSRNTRLSPEGLHKAATLFRALTTAATAEQATSLLESEGFQVDYVEERWGRRLAAVFLEGVRLIDNVPLSAKEESRAPLS